MRWQLQGTKVDLIFRGRRRRLAAKTTPTERERAGGATRGRWEGTVPIINHEYNPRSGENVYSLAEGAEASALAVTRVKRLPPGSVTFMLWQLFGLDKPIGESRRADSNR
jgi:hypothetical protein